MKINQTLYAQYIKDRLGAHIFENDHGFIQYKISGRELFLMEMFIEKSQRGSKLFKQMIEDLTGIAVFEKCEVITANIDIRAPEHVHALTSALKVGFKISRAQNDVLLIFKELVEA